MKRVRARSLGLVFGGLLATGTARAAGVDPPVVAGPGPVGAPAQSQSAELVPKQHPSTKTFYGWQILATGEVGSALAAASVLLPEHPLGSLPSSFGFVIGMPIYALGGPIVHWTHGNFTNGLASFGGNVVFGLGGGLIGQSIRCDKEPQSANCGERGFFTGLAVAALIAPVLDAAILGWEDVPTNEFAGRRSPSTGLAVAPVPTLSLGPRGSFELGFSGRF
jgi:hypothetical protein